METQPNCFLNAKDNEKMTTDQQKDKNAHKEG
jgi:hypothetical protein